MLFRSPDQLLAMIDILMEIDAAKKNISDLLSYLELGFIKMISISKGPRQKTEIINTNVRSINQEQRVIKPDITNNQSEANKKLSAEEVKEKFDKNFKREEVIKDKVIVEEVKASETPNLTENFNTSVDIETSDETLLSMLAFADKQKRINIQPEWENIINYCNQVDVAKYAYKLCKSTILAIGDNYVVVVVEHQSLASDLNSQINQPGLTEFLKEKLNEELRVFAITKEKSAELVELFKTRAINDDLPEKVEIQLMKNKVEKKQDDLLHRAKDIFGEDGFIVEE